LNDERFFTTDCLVYSLFSSSVPLCLLISSYISICVLVLRLQGCCLNWLGKTLRTSSFPNQIGQYTRNVSRSLTKHQHWNGAKHITKWCFQDWYSTRICLLIFICGGNSYLNIMTNVYKIFSVLVTLLRHWFEYFMY